MSNDTWVVAEQIPTVKEASIPLSSSSPVPAALGSARESRLNVGLASQIVGAIVIIAIAAKFVWFTPPTQIDNAIGAGVNMLGAVSVDVNTGLTPPAMIAEVAPVFADAVATPVPPTERVIERIVEVPVVEYVVQTVVDRVEVPVEVIVERVVEVERIVVDRGPAPSADQAVVCITTGTNVTAVYIDGSGIPSGCHVLPVALVSSYELRFTGK